MTSAQLAIFVAVPIVMLWWNYVENRLDGHYQIEGFLWAIVQTFAQLAIFVVGVMAIKWVWVNVPSW